MKSGAAGQDTVMMHLEIIFLIGATREENVRQQIFWEALLILDS
jgi:hypothetical protein